MATDGQVDTNDNTPPWLRGKKKAATPKGDARKQVAAQRLAKMKAGK